MNWYLGFLINIRRYILSSFFLLLLCDYSTGQNIDNLKFERERIQKDIDAANKLLIFNKKEQSHEIENLNLLQAQIHGRESIISSYQKEILEIRRQINESDLNIKNLEKDITKYRQEYELLLLELYKRRDTYDATCYILSSSSFNQAFQRFRMIQELNVFRKNQVIVLRKSELQLSQEREMLLVLKSRLENSLDMVKVETSKLSNQQIERQSYLVSLKSKEKALFEEIKVKRNSDEVLEKKILELIASAAKTHSKSNAGGDFGKNKGNLVWPVQSGIVISYFGEHDHPVLKGVKIKNNGIDLRVNGSNSVRSVFEGEVSRIVGIPGYNKAVIIRHGKFLTVYANLDDIEVRTGQTIKEGQVIGKVYNGESENSNCLHFEIWQENVKQNPELWLKM